MMNEAEYNRKMKGLNRDLVRLTAETDTLGEKMRATWVKRAALVLGGWTE